MSILSRCYSLHLPIHHRQAHPRTLYVNSRPPGRRHQDGIRSGEMYWLKGKVGDKAGGSMCKQVWQPAKGKGKEVAPKALQLWHISASPRRAQSKDNGAEMAQTQSPCFAQSLPRRRPGKTWLPVNPGKIPKVCAHTCELPHVLLDTIYLLYILKVFKGLCIIYYIYAHIWIYIHNIIHI